MADEYRVTWSGLENLTNVPGDAIVTWTGLEVLRTVTPTLPIFVTWSGLEVLRNGQVLEAARVTWSGLEVLRDGEPSGAAPPFPFIQPPFFFTVPIPQPAASRGFAGVGQVGERLVHVTWVGVEVLLSLVDVAAAPINLTPPVIDGNPFVGETLTLTSYGTWANAPTFTQQWRRDGVDIPGQTGLSLLLTSTSLGKVITCAVTGTNVFGSTLAISNALGPVIDLPPGDYRITAGGDYRITAAGDFRIWVAPAPPSVLVHNTAELTAALAAATGGELIRCTVNTYAGWNPDNLNFPTPVTIVSDVPATPAVFRNFTMNNTNGIHFEDVELSGLDPTNNAFVFDNCGDLSFVRVNAHGPVPGMSTTMTIMQFLSCDGVVLEDGELHHAARGATFGNSLNVTVQRNKIHDFTNDGGDIAKVTNFILGDNWIFNFFPPLGSHPDNWQGFTTGTVGSSTNVTFEGNLIELGTGQPAQGIFGGDESGGLKPWINLSFIENMINGQGGNSALRWGRGQNVLVDSNELITWIGGAAGTTGLLMQNCAGITFANNRTHTAIGTAGCTGIVSVGNITNEPAVADQGAARVAAWRLLHPQVPV